MFMLPADRSVIPYFIFGALLLHIYYYMLVTPDTDLENPFKVGLYATACTLALNVIYHYTGFHQKLGFFGVQEPKAHFYFTLCNVWVVFLWVLGLYWSHCLFGVRQLVYPHKLSPNDHFAFLRWEFPAWLHIPPPTSWPGRVIAIAAVFYTFDFTRYWSHRLGHYQFFFNTFPFAHRHHHNQFFLNPFTVFFSPFWHSAHWFSYFPHMLIWAIGWREAAIWGFGIAFTTNYSQHLGFDPLPWVTRLNHYYFYGAIPWIPLYHQYHHIPFVKRGNYGNLTVLWDYVFGTLIAESVQHIETGKMPESVLKRFVDPVKLERDVGEKLNGRNRLDYNNSWDWSMFSLKYM